jgi:nucleoside-diphosphate-sugar epimerase
LRILVTGAAGFTGLHFLQAASAAGHEALSLRSDLRDADALRREVEQIRPDAVVHLAGISFVGHADERAFYDVNLFGTLNLVEAASALGSPPRLLLASSANVYGNSEHSPLAETEPLAPVNHYAASKVAMEHLARARAGSVPLVITRPFNYTGPSQSTQFVIPKLIDHFRRRSARVPLGNLGVEREYNDVRLVCASYLRLLEEGVAPGTYNVCSGRTYKLSAVLEMLARITGHRPEVDLDASLVRANEIQRLCGSPARLRAAIGELPEYALEDTLSWMLETAQ